MGKLKIVHLFNFHKGSRYHAMISQGLYAHPDIEVSFAMPFVSLGNIVSPADQNLQDSLVKADYIFRCDDKHFEFDEIDRFLDVNGLWSKVIYYDFKDSSDIDYHRLSTCAAYIKRSWTKGIDRDPVQMPDIPILPVDFSLLDEYFERAAPEKKDIDICYMFPPDKRIGIRRYNVYKELDAQKSSFKNAAIGMLTTFAQIGRRGIFNPPENNPFLDYLDYLKRSKIVFTAFPDPWDGDSRTWEAFSSEALVFMDTTAIPSPKPFISGKHCFIYDARKPESIRNAIATAKGLLNDEKTRLAIAKEGLNYVCSFHKPVNRINRILKWVRSPIKKLSEHVEII